MFTDYQNKILNLQIDEDFSKVDSYMVISKFRYYSSGISDMLQDVTYD